MGFGVWGRICFCYGTSDVRINAAARQLLPLHIWCQLDALWSLLLPWNLAQRTWSTNKLSVLARKCQANKWGSAAGAVAVAAATAASCLTRLYRFGTRHAVASNFHLPLAAGHIMLQHEHLNLQLRPFGLICVRCEAQQLSRLGMPPLGTQTGCCAPTICINMQRV